MYGSGVCCTSSEVLGVNKANRCTFPALATRTGLFLRSPNLISFSNSTSINFIELRVKSSYGFDVVPNPLEVLQLLHRLTTLAESSTQLLDFLCSICTQEQEAGLAHKWFLTGLLIVIHQTLSNLSVNASDLQYPSK
jgi:hypothetical protein